MRVLTTFGTRPEAIKMAPVVKALDEHESVRQTLCVTAQHREMLDQVLQLFGITPDIDLNLMRERQSLSQLTSRVITEMDRVIGEVKPDVILVHGDTTTTAAASVAAFYHGVPVGHVEAGLRTYDLTAPWPEEFNRRVCDLVTSFYFAPTEAARGNLLREGIEENRIHVTGNTVVDALKSVVRLIGESPERVRELEGELGFLDAGKRLVLVTGHRRESFGSGLERICDALKAIAQRDDVEIVYPVHLNPEVQETVHARLDHCERIHLVGPLEYFKFVYLLNRCYLVLTDSGGIQEEAPELGKPVLVMREVTERPEAIEAGTARLVGTSVERITREVERLLDDPAAYDVMSKAVNPFGDGTASTQIRAVLLEHFVKGPA